jgi:glutathione synthase/RimK-type ligase-like ATP-grasp enzyme
LLVEKPVAVLYEHPLWFEPLFAELERRGSPYERLHAERLAFDPSERDVPYSLVVNRMSPSAWTRGHAGAIFHTLDYLAYLEGIGVRVMNGYGPYSYELSKARQCALFAHLGVRHPRTRVVNHRGAALAAAAELRFPVLVKPNVGGSGAGIVSFDSIDELAEAELDFGLDGTALVQERIPAAGDSVVRIELLGGELLYAIRLLLVPGSFNLCPADYCELPGVTDGVSGRGAPIEAFEPPERVVDDAKRIAAAAELDVCGIEYVVDARDGLVYFYDVNALSNFVADAPNVIGFDPFVNLVDAIAVLADQASEQGGGPLHDRAPRAGLDSALTPRLAEARGQPGGRE